MSHGSLRFCDFFAGVGGVRLGLERAGHRCLWSCEIDPFVRRVYGERFGRAPEAADINAVQPRDIPNADLWAGGFPCFPAGTLILCKSGFKDVSAVVVGDEVLTHLGRWKPVTATMRRQAPTILLKGQGHYGLRTTAEHPFYAVETGRLWNNDRRQYDKTWSAPAWTDAKDMNGKSWATPTAFPPSKPPPVLREGAERARSVPDLTPELFWVLGYWLGDGWLNMSPRHDRPAGQTHGKVLLTVPDCDADELQKRIEAAGLHATRAKDSPAVTTTKFIICSKPLCRWLLTHFGQYSDGKRIPSWVYGLPRQLLDQVYDGYMWADGSDLSAGAAGQRATTINKNMALGFRIIGSILGMSTGLYFDKRPATTVIEGREVNQASSYTVTFYPNDRSMTHRVGGHVFSKVKSLVDDGLVCEVFNFEVEEDNSYVADGIVVHNCQDLSAAGQRKGLERGTRSGLVWKLLDLAADVRPRWLLLENVLGLLSIDKGRGFGRLLAGLDEAGYSDVAWRVLDARWHGVPQRRRRIFLLARRAGDGPSPGEVLLEPAGSGWDPAQGGETGPKAARGARRGAARAGRVSAARGTEEGESEAEEEVSPPLGTPSPSAGHRCDPFDGGGALVERHAATLTAGVSTPGVRPPGRRKEDDENLVVVAGAFNSTAESGRGGNGWSEDVSPPVRVGTGIGIPSPPAVVLGRAGAPTEPGWVGYHVNAAQSTAKERHAFESDYARCLDTTGGFAAGQGGTILLQEGEPIVAQCHGTNVGPLASLRTGHNETSGVPFTLSSVGVRRLLPLECERLMGFPDDWTALEGATDAQRYKACGNSVAVPVLAGIGARLARAEAEYAEKIGLPDLPRILTNGASSVSDARRRVALWVISSQPAATADLGLLRASCERLGCDSRLFASELRGHAEFESVDGRAWSLSPRGRQAAWHMRLQFGVA